MADLRISELPVLLPADLEATDDLAVADYSASETKRVTVKGVVQTGFSLLDAGSIPGSKLADNSVTALQLAPNSVGASELADGSVDTAAVVALAITNSKVAAGLDGAKLLADSVTAAQIAPAAITDSELAPDAVATAAVKDGAITNAKLATGINGAKLAAGSVTDAQLASGIDGAKLQAGSVGTTELADGSVTNVKVAAGLDGAKLSNGSVGTTQLNDASVTAAKLATNSVTTAAVVDAAITNAKLAAASVTTSSVVDGAITDAKLAADSVTTAAVVDAAITNAKLATGIDGAKLSAGSVTAVKLAADSVTTAAVVDAAITDDKLAAGIDGAKLNDGSVTAVKLAVNSVATPAVQDAAITDAKLAAGIDGAKLNDGSVTATKLAADSVTTAAVVDAAITDDKLATGIDGAKLNDGSVTATKLAADSVTTAAVVDAAITDDKLATGIDGAKLQTGTVAATALAAGSLTATQINPAALDRGLDKTSGAIGHTNVITAGTANGITYDAHGHVVAVGALGAADLPVATDLALGGVSVPAASGLTVSGVGALGHASAITAGTTSGFTYNSSGHITAVAPLGSADLPLATPTTAGAVTVPGPALQIAGGVLTHADSVVLPGSYAKVTVDQKGHVTLGGALDAADIPNLPASKITSGTFGANFLADRSVTADKLADYALAFIQEAVPTAGVGSHPIGMTWLQESTGQVSVWNGNSWMKTGASTLFNRNLRYCGTFDATTATITGVTQFGTAEGYAIGDTIPAADDKQAGVYFVCSVAGSSASLAGGAVFDAGDWVLNQGTAGGWVRIDTLSGGGGGSTVSHIADLLDVTLTSPAKDQMLVYTSGGQWVNKPAPGGASTTAPTAPTTGQLWTDSSKSPPVVNVFDGTKWVPVGAPPADASETAKGIVELATVAEAEAGTDTARAITPAGLKAGILKISGGASNTAPTTPVTGQLWTDTSKSPPVLNVWDGTKWVPIGSTEASETVKGIVELATTAEVKTGTDTVKAVTPKTLADNYLAKNIALLTALP